MAKHRGISMPTGQGGLTSTFSSYSKSKIEFSPKFVVVFSLVIVLFVWVLFAVN